MSSFTFGARVMDLIILGTKSVVNLSMDASLIGQYFLHDSRDIISNFCLSLFHLLYLQSA
jgi:hypothetical protein